MNVHLIYHNQTLDHDNFTEIISIGSFLTHQKYPDKY